MSGDADVDRRGPGGGEGAGEGAEAPERSGGVAPTGPAGTTWLTGGDTGSFERKRWLCVPGKLSGESVGLDWLTVTAMMPIEELGKWAARWFGPLEWQDSGHGYRWWGRSSIGTSGAFLRGEMAGHPEWSAVELPGEVCNRSLGRVRRALLELDRATGDGMVGSKWRVTRLDFRWDGGAVSPGWLRDAIQSGDARCYARRMEWRDSSTGQTCYIGRDGTGHAEVVICVYNARGFNRVELRVYKGRALALAWMLMTVGGREWEARCRGVLASQVECDAEEWRDLVGDADRLQLPGDPRSVRSIESNAAHVRRQAKSLAIYTRLHGASGLRRVVEEGGGRLSLRELAEYGLGAAPRAAYWPPEG